MANNPSACASLRYALTEFLTPPTMVIVRGEASKIEAWRDTMSQIYYPHHLFFYLDEKWDKNMHGLPPTLHRNSIKDVNAWVCKGVGYSSSVNDLCEFIKYLYALLCILKCQVC